MRRTRLRVKKPITSMQLDQFKNYLIGYYYHSKGDFKMALKHYTKSLYSKDNKLVGYWRLLSLE